MFLPTLGGAEVIQKWLGLPMISPGGYLIVFEPRSLRGLFLLSAGNFGGIDCTTGSGYLASNIVKNNRSWIGPSLLRDDRFGDW